ncbi:hypothetical protein LTR60_003681, partial [Cryomyces antarcticus]
MSSYIVHEAPKKHFNVRPKVVATIDAFVFLDSFMRTDEQRSERASLEMAKSWSVDTPTP